MPAMKLSPADRHEIDAVCANLLAHAWSTEPIDPDRCHRAVAEAYGHRAVAVPEIVMCASPIEAMSRLQRLSPAPEPSARRPVPDLERVLEDGTSLAGIWNVMVSAQPRTWPALGSEVDLSFHGEVFSALDSIPWDSEAWPPVRKRIESKVLDLCHLSHCVSGAHQRQVTAESEAWLLYTQGAATLWAEAVEYGALEVALALGHVGSAPSEFKAGRELLASCAWVYSFERLCIVCERPAELQQTKKGREVQTSIRWRDGTQCERVFS
jgi:hypothetical protein